MSDLPYKRNDMKCNNCDSRKLVNTVLTYTNELMAIINDR